jgi:hypothetical protein
MKRIPAGMGFIIENRSETVKPVHSASRGFRSARAAG